MEGIIKIPGLQLEPVSLRMGEDDLGCSDFVDISFGLRRKIETEIAVRILKLDLLSNPILSRIIGRHSEGPTPELLIEPLQIG